MSRWIFFAIFIFSFYSWGQSEEYKKHWSETGYNFEIVFEKLKADYCYQSEKRFSGCMMAFHKLLKSAKKDEPYQLKVSNLSDLEIVPYPEQEQPKNSEEQLASEKKRRESFRLFFRTVTRAGHTVL